MRRGILVSAAVGFLIGFAVGLASARSASPWWWAVTALAGAWVGWGLARGFGRREDAPASGREAGSEGPVRAMPAAGLPPLVAAPAMGSGEDPAAVLPLLGGGGPQPVEGPGKGSAGGPAPGQGAQAPGPQPPAVGQEPSATGPQPPATGQQAAGDQPGPQPLAAGQQAAPGQPGAPQGTRPATRQPGQGFTIRAITYQQGFPAKDHKVRARLRGRGLPGPGR